MHYSNFRYIFSLTPPFSQTSSITACRFYYVANSEKCYGLAKDLRLSHYIDLNCLLVYVMKLKEANRAVQFGNFHLLCIVSRSLMSRFSSNWSSTSSLDMSWIALFSSCNVCRPVLTLDSRLSVSLNPRWWWCRRWWWWWWSPSSDFSLSRRWRCRCLCGAPSFWS